MAINRFDKLNVPLQEKIVEEMRSLDYEEYFGEMELTEKQIEERISLAEKLEDEVLFILSLVYALSEYQQTINWQDIQNRFRNAYVKALGQDRIDDYLQGYIDNMSFNLADSTKANLGDTYNTSYDRARYIAENEANSILNYEDEQLAISQGKKYKTWITMQDKRVRHTHNTVNGKKIPIGNFFEVGSSLMRFPKDSSLGVLSSEVINCRCSCKYS